MMMHTSMESTELKKSSNLSSNAALLLRRKSLHVQDRSSSMLSENNDEAERMAKRREMDAITLKDSSLNTKNKRQSLGLSFLANMSAPEMKNRITECIKLNTENRINVKNAFSVEIIDFMAYMIKKQDSDMSNLQVASTSLDVSTKIYGFRVDSVHTQLMKMAGGLDKQEGDVLVNDTDENVNNEQESEVHEQQKIEKKKRKTCKQKMFTSINNLKGTVEIMKPSLWIIENQDSQTTDSLYQVMLSNHAHSKYYLHLYNDVIVDTIDTLKPKAKDENIKVAIPKIEDFSALELCPPVTHFDFIGWTSDNEPEVDKKTQAEDSNEGQFQFDLDISVPPDDEVVYNNANYLDIDDEEENVDKCAEAPKQIEKIVDVCKVVSNIGANKTSEYSFLQKTAVIHWAGPSHWKISNFTKVFGESKTVATCQQEPVRKGKDIEICYNDDVLKAGKPKFTISKALKSDFNKLHGSEETYILPRDMHYNIANATKLYLHKLIDITVEKKDQLNITHISNVEDYDYNNENDVSNYCPNIPNEDYEINNDNDNECNVAEGETEVQMVFTGDNLVTVPKLTNKISIAFDTHAKKIDMRQLKKSIWRSLVLNNNTENNSVENMERKEEENKIEQNKYFSKIYKLLPNMLTKTNMEALSFPISFVSLLHLVNEKTLKLQFLPDMSDLIIEAN
ncbi:condensin complex subunit 2 [Xylocopa sonorina]|uniref:condensin complex subunit 2 n=1 Tax=Xylocopa sonorina TaxID=1818115 RepID=UPI00403A92EF